MILSGRVTPTSEQIRGDKILQIYDRVRHIEQRNRDKEASNGQVTVVK